VDRAEWRRDQVLLPTFGDRRLPRQQGAKILKSNFAGDETQCSRSNGYRYGLSSPPTPKRPCVPFTQRHTATPHRHLPPDGGMREVFMVRLTLRRR
jgi:hypothetical protein